MVGIASGMMLLFTMTGVSAEALRLVQAQAGTEKAAPPAEKMPGKAAIGTVKVRGTVDAIDKEKSTVTLKGPKGRTLTLDVKDKQKLDAIKVGDPVVATYMEAVAFQVKKAGQPRPA